MRVTQVTAAQFSRMRSKPPWRILFFGTDEFSVRILQALNENRVAARREQCMIETLHLSHPEAKKLTPVMKYAAVGDLLGIEYPIEKLRKNSYDVGVVASFGHLIPRKIVEAFPYGILNVHPSLLPRWRGAAPIHHTILNGDSTTGVSIMSIKPKHFDIGPLLSQKEFKVPEDCTMSQLREMLSIEGGKMIIETLSSLPQSIVAERPQSEDGITYAHKITVPMSFIDWRNQTVDSIDRQYRALHETTELRTDWEGLVVRLIDMVNQREITPNVKLDDESPPGLPVFDKQNNVLWTKCKDGWVGFSNIVIKKTMSAKAFNNGYLTKKHLKGVTFRSKSNSLFNDDYQQWIQQRRPS